MNKHLIWVFRELVILLNNLHCRKEDLWTQYIYDCMISHELNQTNLDCL